MGHGLPPRNVLHTASNPQQERPAPAPVPTTWAHITNYQQRKLHGLCFTNDLSWNEHINNVCSKANKTLGFLRRNLKISSREIKETAYKTLVRPIMEYAATVWDPLTQANIDNMEAVQHRAARFVLRSYRNTSSVSNMIDGPHSRTDAELLGLPCYTKFDTNWSARTSYSVNRMLQDLNLSPLAERRRHARLALMYKITGGLIPAITPPPPPLNKKQNKTNKQTNKNKLPDPCEC